MTRLATHIAAAFAGRDSLPPVAQLPVISLTEALLPRSWTGTSTNSARSQKSRDQVESNTERRSSHTYYEVKKDRKGRKTFVAHRSPMPSVHDVKDGDVKGDEKKKEDKAKDGGNGNGKKDEKKAEKKDEKKEKGGGGDGENKNPNKKEWTAEEDAELRALKVKNTSWRDIAKEMKRSQQQCKDRWKEIEGKADGEKKDEKNEGGKDKGGEKDKSGGGEKKKGEEKQGKQNKEKNKNKNEKKEDKKEKKQEEPKSKPASEARFTMREWLTLQEDDTFSFGELQLLTELVMRNQNQTWLRIAARFFDKTGRRVHPETIREKFEELARMGA